jgi:hypothetical protein
MPPGDPQIQQYNSYEFLISLNLSSLCELLNDKTLELLSAKSQQQPDRNLIRELTSTVITIQAAIKERKNDLPRF